MLMFRMRLGRGSACTAKVQMALAPMSEPTITADTFRSFTGSNQALPSPQVPPSSPDITII